MPDNALEPAEPQAPLQAPVSAPDVARHVDMDGANLARIARRDAQRSGDLDAVAQHDAAERVALGGEPDAPSVPAVRDDVYLTGSPAEQAAARMEATDFGAYCDLVLDSHWGDPAGEQFARSYALAEQLGTELGERYPALDRMLATAQYQDEAGAWQPVAGHPELVRALAHIGRKLSAPKAGQRGTTRRTTAMSDEATVMRAAREVRDKRALALSRGHVSEALRFDEEERRLYAKLDRDKALVGRQGRTV